MNPRSQTSLPHIGRGEGDGDGDGDGEAAGDAAAVLCIGGVRPNASIANVGVRVGVSEGDVLADEALEDIVAGLGVWG